jgi:hypothetical protein
VPASAEARLSDLRALVDGLESKHPALRGSGGAQRRKAFEARAAELGSRLHSLRPDQVEVEMAGLVASLGDGHTGLVLPTYSVLPLELYCFGGVWYVTRVSAEYRDLLGARLTAIGGFSIEEIVSRLEPIVSHDNASGLASQLPYRLVMPDILSGVGALPPGAQETRVETIDASGSKVELNLRAWRYGEAEPEFVSLPVPASSALSRARQGEAYWCSLVPGTRTLYIAYNRCREDPKKSMKAFAKEVDSILSSGSADRVFVDLRNNGGGSSPLFWPLLRVLASQARGNGRGGRGAIPVYAAIGRRTFSSAVLDAAELARGQSWPLSILAPSAAATFVGEASGGRPNHYGEVKSFVLPESRLRVQYSTMKFHAWPEDSDALYPAISAPPTWADYVSGRDSALEAVVALELPAAGSVGGAK